MIYSIAYTLLAVGLVSQTLAEPSREPYQPKLARMSTRNIFGLHRRDMEGYSPTEQLCGAGDTCAEACGKGFGRCASKDGVPHCYNQLKKETCCPNGSGDSCDNGYFCTADERDATWCCPDGLSLKECAQKYNVPGSLTSQVPSTTKTTTKATATKGTSSKASATTTKVTTTKDASTESTTTKTKSKKPESTDSTESTTTAKVVHPQSTSKSTPDETSTTSSSESTTTLLIDVTNAFVTTQAIATQVTILDAVPSSTPSASPSTSSIGESGSGSHGPASSLILLLAAGALAALV
ncbi:hypothetical protein E0Z10_g10803 [Xylaria hypoxylon]|uniref:Prp 4 CRoW domain-containing protein n=1 Tax=Xylaria hypoxylon TaxID=37992 RepID=A0A4Z0Y1W1_9PEZI|nr:hypothetical protein E0Z10_g10803 [Xylaria hypoxylon]